MKTLDQEKSDLTKQCIELEHTSVQMEEALRNSEAKMREYRKKEVTHLEVIETYVKDINALKGNFF